MLASLLAFVASVAWTVDDGQSLSRATRRLAPVRSLGVDNSLQLSLVIVHELACGWRWLDGSGEDGWQKVMMQA